MSLGVRVISLVAAAAAVSFACAPIRMQLDPPIPSCRTVNASDAQIRWIVPSTVDDRNHLRSWCDAVGPIVVHDPGVLQRGSTRQLTIVSWNMAVGTGDLPGLLNQVRGEHADGDVIVLLQEAYRAKDPPAVCADGSGRAGAIGQPRPAGSADIVELAKAMGLHAMYAPSMRNGTDCAKDPREDRGNAILSTLPLSDFAAIELPFAQQRRVAVAATVHLADRTLGVMSTHFDTWRGHKRMAEGLSQAIDLLGWKADFVIAGDFNSAVRSVDSGLGEMRARFTEVDCGKGPTHALGGRLDHIFVGLHDAAPSCRTGADRHGSDHSPLIASR